LDVVPYVLSDGYTINLSLIPSVTELLGYESSPTNAANHANSAGVHQPAISPKLSVRWAVANVNVRDNQTVVLGGLVEKNIPDDKKSVVNPPANEKELLVFVTATIVDPAGNRVHADDDLPPAKTGIPPQPAK
jgi:Flp pilus assembly secretin CpaC